MTTYNDNLSEYITDLFAVQDAALVLAWEDTRRKGLPAISVRPEEGRFLQFLVRASQAVKAVEIGTLGGFSGIWIARGLAPGGKLITLEMEPRHAQVAREHIEAAGLSHAIEVRVGDAHHQLAGLADESPFDFVFIDADKPGYPHYFDWALEHVRIGGVIAAHNAFRGGSILKKQNGDADESELMSQFNHRVAQESRVISTIFPAGDGMLLAVKIA
jgi:predicted O-methyltransferase YrrM